MAGKRVPAAAAAKGSHSSASSKTRSHASTSKPKPSLLGMKPAPAPTKGKSKKRAAQKARDADVRAELDGGNLSGLRQALKSADKSKPLVEKKQAPAELAKGGDSLAKSMDEVLDLLGAA
ncbi:hypothetical protein C6P46_001211 [Rhodotorula mucilaginosa]|uniref:Ribosome biogenesis protein SLX9 n=1 Tax=Rhodotorula mucilaginosa TaxID=5537 RepID=A0A9P6W7G6_RHOMI|nr:hypothetical protein C6P46_001211 [Rhodotorula mucilaginosa]